MIRLWVMPITNSFWLDETTITWAIRDGFWPIFAKVTKTPQSVAFCILEWLVARTAGVSETALRLPSVAAAVGALYIYYRIGVEFLDREAGFTFAAIYITLQQVSIEVPNARPYSLALLLHVAALFWLLRWVRDGRILHGLLWIICAIVAGQFHHFFLIALPLEAAFLAWCIFRNRPIKIGHLALCAFVGAILFAPAIPQILSMSQQVTSLYFAEKPPFSALFLMCAPIYVLPAVALLVYVERTEKKVTSWTAPKATDLAVLGALIMTVPIVVFFVLARMTSVQLFAPRYLLPTVPGLVLLWGWLLHGINSVIVRLGSLVAGLITAMLITGQFSAVPDYQKEDWRSAVRSLPDSGALLVYSGLVETRHVDWLRQPERWGYLIAPVLAYRPRVTVDDGFVLPFDFGASDQGYVEELISGPLRDRSNITIIVRRSFWGPEWIHWASDRLRRSGFRLVRESQYGRVQVDVFQRVLAPG